MKATEKTHFILPKRSAWAVAKAFGHPAPNVSVWVEVNGRPVMADIFPFSGCAPWERLPELNYPGRAL